MEEKDKKLPEKDSPKEEFRREAEVHVLNPELLKLNQYYGVMKCDQKTGVIMGYIAKDKKIILYEKNVKRVTNAGIRVNACQDLAKEHHGFIVRADKIMKQIKGGKINAPISSVYVVGRLKKRVKHG